MAVDVKVPAVGESVQEAMIHKWHKASGEAVKRDDVLMELETDKATVEVTAETDGVIEILNKEGDTVAIGQVVARIDASASPTKAASAVKSAPASTPPPSQTAASGGEPPLMPAARRLVEENRLDANTIPGTGKGGRVTKGDVLQHMESGASAPKVVAPTLAKAPVAPPPHLPVAKSSAHGRGERREPMSMLRRRVAERLVQAQSTAAILTTFNEVDMKAVMDLRKQYKDGFKDKHGIGLGFMSFFVKAAIEALKTFPAINGWIEGNEIVYHDYYDIGVAVSGDRGLVVPVIRDADKLSMAEVEQSIAHYAGKARDGKISVDDLSGGTFTISNGGTFGSLLSTPILNPPQSAILGMHKIEERPIALNGQVVIRPMMYLALSYDHRIVDGKEAVQFLVKIKEMVEDPTRLLLGV
ncbi:MAG: 2-oxoglutarate dehydrogenase complex dihydrolipoyllysine-residue succinyltransferase [Deltaproteobacteria bacterium]|nr:2-oxoglutarate dehydrogenase complex dihydrolipoyllysine-residue succinyltransferase [Deltaproteobacteria bacterium]